MILTDAQREAGDNAMSSHGRHKRGGARTILMLGSLLLGTGFLCAQQEYAEDSLLGGFGSYEREESPRKIYGVTEPGSVGNSLLLTISNRDERVSIASARAELVSDPSSVANLQFDPPTVSDIEPGESKQIRVRFDVDEDAPLGESEMLRFRVFDEEGRSSSWLDTSLWLTYVSNAPLVLRLVKIEAYSPRSSDGCQLDYREGQAGLVTLCEKEGSRVAASVALGRFPYEIVFGEPFEFEAEVKYQVRYSPGHPCHEASGGAEQLEDCRELFTRTTWNFHRHWNLGYITMDGKGPETVRTTLRFVPERCMVPSNLGAVGCDDFGGRWSQDPAGEKRRNDEQWRSISYKIETEPAGMDWAYQTPEKLTIYWPSQYKADNGGFVRLFSSHRHADGTPIVSFSLLRGLEEVPSEHSVAFALDVSAGGSRAELKLHYRPVRRGDSSLSSVQPFRHPDLGPELSGDEADSLSDAGEESDDRAASELSDEGRTAGQAPLRRPVPSVEDTGVTEAERTLREEGFAPRARTASPGPTPDRTGKVQSQSPGAVGERPAGTEVGKQVYGPAEPESARAKSPPKPSSEELCETYRGMARMATNEQVRASALQLLRGMGCSAPPASISPPAQETGAFPPPDDPRFDPPARKQDRTPDPTARQRSRTGTVPRVVALEAKQAKDAIEAQGYTMEVEVGSPARRETDAYRVSRQQPAAGSLLARGGAVKITIWDRWSAPQKRVPDVVGSRAADAKATLERQGFIASVEVGAPAESEGEAYTVARQTPGSGTPAPAGAQVALRVHGPYQPKPEPERSKSDPTPAPTAASSDADQLLVPSTLLGRKLYDDLWDAKPGPAGKLILSRPEPDYLWREPTSTCISYKKALGLAPACDFVHGIELNYQEKPVFFLVWMEPGDKARGKRDGYNWKSYNAAHNCGGGLQKDPKIALYVLPSKTKKAAVLMDMKGRDPSPVLPAARDLLAQVEQFSVPCR